MTTATKKSRKAEKPGGVTGIVTNTYRKTMDFGERVSVATLNMPYIFLEAVGVDEERTSGIKNFNARFVGRVYAGTDWMATRAGNVSLAPFRLVGKGISKLTGGSAKAKAPKKAPKKEAKKPAAKKAAPKKAKRPVGVKKAPAKKKAPPKVAAARRPTKLAA